MDYLSRIDGPGKLITLLGNFPMLKGRVETKENAAVYRDDTVRVTSSYTQHPFGITIRSDTVENISGNPICIRTALSRFQFNGGEYEVYTQYSQWTHESQGAWQRLVTAIGGCNSDIRSNTSSAPFFAVYNQQTSRGLAFHILCDGLWKYEVRKQFSSGSTNYLLVELGLDNTNLALELQPGESLALPKILYYQFKNKTDMEAYRLHRYCNAHYRPKAFPVVYNTWMHNFDRISFDSLSQQLTLAKEMGIEYFVIDSGWFGPPNAWFGSVGDWEEAADAGLCGRMQEFAETVRGNGLKFGLWFEIERASLESKAVQAHPEYYRIQNGNAFVDFANEAACDYAFKILSTHIRRYGIEYIKLDFNAALTQDEDQAAFTKYVAGYRQFIARLGREFPQVYLENCASGGLRMSLSSLDGFDSFWISDNHSLYTQLNIFKNTLLRMPSRALETWISIRSIEKFDPVYNDTWGEKIIMSGDACWGNLEVIPESFLYACAVGGPIGVSCDLTRLSSHTRKKMARFIAQYKADRPFWLNSECHILCDTPTMLVLQFCDELYDQLRVFVYARNACQNAVTVYPICTPGAVYTHTNGSSYTAQSLEENGIEVPVAGICAAEFVLTKTPSPFDRLA